MSQRELPSRYGPCPPMIELRMVFRLAWVVLVCWTLSCGRIGFEPLRQGDVDSRDNRRPDAGPADAGEATDGGQEDAGEPDMCPEDPDKLAPGLCGCGVPDDDFDRDGTPDCLDACDGRDDADYVPNDGCGVGHCRTTNTPSTCIDGVETACVPGIPLSDDDATCDGVDDDCDGDVDDDYVVDDSCGVGHCYATNTPSSCTEGVESACEAGTMLATDDVACDGVDSDCDGSLDEDYAPDATCGLGYCLDNNVPSSCVDGVEAACQPGSPLATSDPTADGIDDDCDGNIDEDYCGETTEVFGGGEWLLSPPDACNVASVRLWGGGGASAGSGGFWGSARAGEGGAGGYAAGTYSVTSTSTLRILIGAGGMGCTGAGSSPEPDYTGGAGGSGRAAPGAPGGDGSRGGAGGNPGQGGDGGRGDFGGGGGGAGDDPGFAPSSNGGGGGAASVFEVDGIPVAIAGGGGGGGGVGATIATSGVSGGDGGSGCGGDGATGGSEGGGGGGGGVCLVESATAPDTQPGTGRAPFDPGGAFTPPGGTALGGEFNEGGRLDCRPGGDGYGFVTWSRN